MGEPQRLLPPRAGRAQQAGHSSRVEQVGHSRLAAMREAKLESSCEMGWGMGRDRAETRAEMLWDRRCDRAMIYSWVEMRQAWDRSRSRWGWDGIGGE